MSPRPFPVRLVLSFAVATAVIVAVGGALAYQEGQRVAYARQVQDMDHLTALIRKWVPPGGSLSADDEERLGEAAQLLRTRITLVGGDGTVLFDTHEPARNMANHNDRPEVVEARRGGSGTDIRVSATVARPSLYVARLLDPARPNGPVVRLSDPGHGQPPLPTSAWAIVGGSGLAALTTAGVLWLMLRRRWVGPLRALADTAGRMAGGQWHLRADPGGSEDVRILGIRLNEVAGHARRQLDDLRHQREDLSALVDALPDPIIVVDPQTRITLMNPPAASLLDVAAERLLGQRLVNVINEESLLELFDEARGARRAGDGSDRAIHAEGDARANGQSPAAGTPADPHLASIYRTVRLTRNGQRLTYQAVARRTPGGGVLIVLRDISALASLVQVKTDFVANASHELRTPISAIKIAFETLREVYREDPDQTERCVGIVDGHMKRLEDMLRDLLDLSRVESPELKPFIREVKTADLYALVRSSLGAMAGRKLVELRFGETPATPDSVPTDERLLNVVLKNLVENSIKFTPPGGSVTVTLTAEPPADDEDETAEAEIVVAVADTGIGIPPEHLERVFERFYQVDASRTGSAGRGTGLGLAIVKHAVAALGGTVQIESAAGKGTTVTCRFPQHPPDDGRPGEDLYAEAQAPPAEPQVAEDFSPTGRVPTR